MDQLTGRPERGVLPMKTMGALLWEPGTNSDKSPVSCSRIDTAASVTNTYRLEDINQAFRDMHDGKNIRGVIVYDA
jgi:hypothetical protein